MKLTHDLKLRRKYRLLRRCNFNDEAAHWKGNNPAKFRFLKSRWESSHSRS